MRLIDADKLLERIEKDKATDKMLDAMTIDLIESRINQQAKMKDCEKEIEHLKAWKNDVMESLCKYDASSVEEVYEIGVKAGTKIIDVMKKGEEYDTIIMKNNGRIYKIKCME